MKLLPGLILTMFLFFNTFGASAVRQDLVLKMPTDASLSVNQKKQIECLARNVYFEARGEPYAGQQAVAWVTMNRVVDSNFDKSICDIVSQKSAGVCQFSWYCSDDLRLKVINKKSRGYRDIWNLSKIVYFNYFAIRVSTENPIYWNPYMDPGVLFFHHVSIQDKRKPAVTIGNHSFYKSLPSK